MIPLQRSSFGTWGNELDDYSFAGAIASVGLCAGYSISWPLKGEDASVAAAALLKKVISDEPLRLKYFTAPPESWTNYMASTSARKLADAWEILKSKIPGRPGFIMELDPVTIEDLTGIKWLQQQIETAVGVGKQPSFYLPLSIPKGEINWKWPIRIGFLADRDSRLIMEELIRQTSVQTWFNAICHLINLNESYDKSVDILIIPGGFKNALNALLNSSKNIKANSIGIINIKEDEERIYKIFLDEILQITHSGAIFTVTTQNFTWWISSLIMELSHNKPFDAAIAGSRSNSTDQTVFWSTPEFVQQTSILKYCINLLDDPDLKIDIGDKIQVPEHISRKIGLTPGMYSLKNIKSKILELGFEHEIDGTLVTIEVEMLLKKAMYEKSSRITMASHEMMDIDLETTRSELIQPKMKLMKMAKMERVEKPHRFLQAEVNSGNYDLKKAFSRGENNIVSIFIGPPEKGKIGLPDVFPDSELPETSEDGHNLTVTFFEPNLMKQPVVEELFLPKTGKSGYCRFNLFVTAETKKVQARIIILYNNRILQNAILGGMAVDYLKDVAQITDEKAEIRIVSSFQVPAAMKDLSKRSIYNSAFLLNHNGETPGIFGMQDKKSIYVRLTDADIDKHVTKVESIIDNCNWDKSDFNGLKKPGTTELLRKLALSGSSLYQSVIKRIDSGFAARTAPVKGVPQKIQIVASNISGRMPFEFIYDFPAPGENAQICPQAATALRKGSCKSCPHEKERPVKVICPLGFWCMSRIIEWHAFSEELSETTKGTPFRLTTDDSEEQGKLYILKDPLVGYSNKVKEGRKSSISELQKSFENIGIKNPKIVNSWKDWETSLQTLKPTLEVLLVHTEKDDDNTLIELGDKMISILNLEGLIPDKKNLPAIVLLFGCGTGTSQVQFQSVAAMVEACQAAIIVSTMSDIFGPVASKLAGYFIGQLAKVKNGQTFGDVMLAVRRKSLAAGISMILCLRTYGDADWQLIK